MSRLTTRPIAGADALVAHFDHLASEYEDTHGAPERLLRYRLAIIERLLADARRGTLLEIGCGRAIHLTPLAAGFERALGIDASAEMVRMARIGAQASGWRERIELRVDPAELLATVDDGSIDAVLCVGALEHMLDKPRVLAQVRRVMRPGATFVCLTPNGAYCWYRVLAPLLRLDTRHLSTDRFLTAGELRALVREAGLTPAAFERWRFIPKGDLPAAWGGVLHGLDLAGRVTRAGFLRGGLALAARRGDPRQAIR
ncbi:MAG TPA: class I SAM-dependent methyltransferase [Solirubrobacteraceae bacterium]|jgi:2-polyprenyl-6-hydroxyphenyl methylase/3-demethylubiquinone-9 3-methyltransferase|nr:class I SAM-dependent methyltransferase [Solirubrobacteraceae bacterium]